MIIVFVLAIVTLLFQSFHFLIECRKNPDLSTICGKKLNKMCLLFIVSAEITCSEKSYFFSQSLTKITKKRIII